MGEQTCPQCGAALDAVDAAATLVHCPGCSLNLVPAGATSLSMVVPVAEEGTEVTGGLPFEVHQRIALSPALLERYRFDRLLGAGAMGVVYQAHDIFRDVPVAVKVLNLRGEQYTARFRREGRVMAQLAHPNVVRVLDALEVDGHPCLICEYVQGGSLEAKMKAGPVAVLEAARIARELLAGLAACHELQILHRDIKPANVLLEGGKTAKLADFGLARIGEIGDEEGTLTRAGDRLGTPRYMAPEQFEKGGASTGTDVYAVAVMLHEMVSGQMPFPGRNFAELYEQKRAGLARLDTLMSGVRRGFADAVAAGTSPDLTQRPATAAVFSELLLNALRAGPAPRPGRSGGFAEPAPEDPARAATGRVQALATPAGRASGSSPNDSGGGAAARTAILRARSGGLPVTSLAPAASSGRTLRAGAAAFGLTLVVGLAGLWLRHRPAPVDRGSPSALEDPSGAPPSASASAAPAANAPFLGVLDLRARTLEHAVYVQMRTTVRAPLEVLVTEAKDGTLRGRCETGRDYAKRAVVEGLAPGTRYRVEVRALTADYRVRVDPLEIATAHLGDREKALADQATEYAAGISDNPNGDLRMLVRWGEDADIPRLIDQLNDRTPGPRWASAADAFGVVGTPLGVPKLAWALRNTRKINCGGWVESALRALADIGGDAAVAALEEFVRNGCPDENMPGNPLQPPGDPDELNEGRRRRFLAARCLAVADPVAAVKLFDALRHNPHRLTVSLYGAAIAGAPWCDDAAMQALALGADTLSSNAGVRVAALRGLPDMDAAARTLQRGWSRLTSIRLRAALATYGAPSAIASLARDLEAIAWPTAAGAEEINPWLLSSLDLSALAQVAARTPRGPERAAAVRALGRALDSPPGRRFASLRRQALRGLAWIGDPDAARDVEASHLRDPAPRAEHALALARCGSARAPAAVDALLESPKGTDLWAAAVAAAALPEAERRPRWKRIKERADRLNRTNIRQELNDGLAWLAGGALARPLMWLDVMRCRVPSGVVLQAGQRFRLVAHGLVATRPLTAGSPPEIETSPEPLADCLPPGGRWNVGVNEFATDGVALQVGAFFEGPHPLGWPTLTAQDRGMAYTRLSFHDIGDIHDASQGEQDILMREAQYAGLVLAEIIPEP